MALVKAKALQSTAGSYGMAKEGDEITIDEIYANELEKKGVIKITGKVSATEEKTAADKSPQNMSTVTSITEAPRANKPVSTFNTTGKKSAKK